MEPRHHRHFVARRGEVLHRISDECGGVMISFPRPGVQSDRVVLKGTKDYIEIAKQRIQEIVTDLVSQRSHAHDQNTLRTICRFNCMPHCLDILQVLKVLNKTFLHTC